MNLKHKYNKLFTGKPKSNDQLLTEGTVFLGIGNAKRKINEAENASYYQDLMSQLDEAVAQLNQVIADIDAQTEDDMAYDYEVKAARTTINRYGSAAMKNIAGIRKVLRGLSK
jgi:hypothetical protein